MKLFVTPLVFVAVCVQLSAQEFPNPQPTDAHKILSDEAGIWDADVKMYFQGPTGSATNYKGVESIEVLSGGLHSRSTFRCKMGDTEFEGHGLFGYDPRTKEYTALWVDNFTSVPTALRGKYDSEKKTLTMYATVFDAESERELKQKQVTTYDDKNSKTFSIYLLIDADGKEVPIKIMEMTAKRRTK